MTEHGAFGVEIRGLVASHRGGDFWQDVLEQTALTQQVQAPGRVRRLKELAQFFADSLGANLTNLGCIGFEGMESSCLNLKVELRRQPHSPQKTQVVFREPFCC